MDNIIDFKTIGRRIQFFRKKAGLTQDALAQKMLTSKSYICQVEHGDAVSIQRLCEIAPKINTTLANLVSESDYASPSYLAQDINEIVVLWPSEKKAMLFEIIKAMDKS